MKELTNNRHPSKLAEKSLEYWAVLRSEVSVVPPDHYFHTWLALTALELGRKDLGEELLAEFFALEHQGHIEFNKLALLHIVERHELLLPKVLAEQVAAYLGNGRFSVDFTTHTGNNWLFLRMLVHLKLYLCFGHERDMEDFRTYCDHVVGYADGGMFFDYPPLRSVQTMRAFPLTYSFKMLALLMECLNLLQSNQLEPKRQIILQNLVTESVPLHLDFIAPDGESLYYGRSDNTLFGYANVLAVLARLRSNSRKDRLVAAVHDYIRIHFVTGGILTKATAMSGFRDAYVFDSVYSAYFLGSTLMLEKGCTPLCECPPEAETTVRQTPIGVLVRSPSVFAFITASGCSLPMKGSDFSGYRYTGLSPLKLWRKDLGDARLLDMSRNSLGPLKIEIPLLPLGRGLGTKKLPLIFEDIHINDNGSECKMQGRATPVAMISHALWSRILRRICRNRPNLKRWLLGVPCHGLDITRCVQINYSTGTLSLMDNLPPGRWYYVIPSFWQSKGDIIRRKTLDADVNRLLSSGGRVILSLGFGSETSD